MFDFNWSTTVYYLASTLHHAFLFLAVSIGARLADQFLRCNTREKLSGCDTRQKLSAHAPCILAALPSTTLTAAATTVGLVVLEAHALVTTFVSAFIALLHVN